MASVMFKIALAVLLIITLFGNKMFFQFGSTKFSIVGLV